MRPWLYYLAVYGKYGQWEPPTLCGPCQVELHQNCMKPLWRERCYCRCSEKKMIDMNSFWYDDNLIHKAQKAVMRKWLSGDWSSEEFKEFVLDRHEIEAAAIQILTENDRAWKEAHQ